MEASMEQGLIRQDFPPALLHPGQYAHTRHWPRPLVSARRLEHALLHRPAASLLHLCAKSGIVAAVPPPAHPDRLSLSMRPLLAVQVVPILPPVANHPGPSPALLHRASRPEIRS